MKLLRCKLPAFCAWARVLGVDESAGKVNWCKLPSSGVHLLFEGTIVLSVLKPHVIRVYRVQVAKGDVGSTVEIGDRAYHTPDDTPTVIELIQSHDPRNAVNSPENLVRELINLVRAQVEAGHVGYIGIVRACLEARAAGSLLPEDAPESLVAWVNALAEDVASALDHMLGGVSDLYGLEQRWGALREDTRRNGLSERYHVHRADGRDRPGGDRAGAKYFVLDLTYDPYSLDAAAAYAQSACQSFPALADDLLRIPGVRAAYADIERAIEDRAAEIATLAMAKRRDRILAAIADGAGIDEIQARVIAELTHADPHASGVNARGETASGDTGSTRSEVSA